MLMLSWWISDTKDMNIRRRGPMPEQSIYMGEVGQVLWVEDKETCRAFMGEVWQVPWVENIERCVVHMGEVRKIDCTQ